MIPVDMFYRAMLEEDPFTRMKMVVRWYLSGFYKKPKVSYVSLFAVLLSASNYYMCGCLLGLTSESWISVLENV